MSLACYSLLILIHSLLCSSRFVHPCCSNKTCCVQASLTCSGKLLNNANEVLERFGNAGGKPDGKAENVTEPAPKSFRSPNRVAAPPPGAASSSNAKGTCGKEVADAGPKQKRRESAADTPAAKRLKRGEQTAKKQKDTR